MEDEGEIPWAGNRHSASQGLSALQVPLRNLKASDSQPPRRTHVYAKLSINFRRPTEPKFLRLGNQGVFNCKGRGGQQNEMKTNPRAFHLGN